MTPLHLSILLAAHTGSPFAYDSNELRQKYAQDLVDWGLVVETDGLHGIMHAVTNRGHVWVGHILTVPFPEQRWVVPDRAESGGGA